MFKHATRVTLALTTLLHLSTAARHPRSIWPWSSSDPREEPLISEEQAEILRQAGYGHYLDLSGHPLWKIHKYEGIDLKPVRLETEIIRSEGGGGGNSPPRLPQLDGRNPVSPVSPSVAPVTESQSQHDAESADPSDQSDSGLFDHFSPLSYFFSKFGFGSSGDEEEEERQEADALVEAIRDEEKTHPGFFAALWSKIWGSDAAVVEQREGDPPLRVALPPTRQRYAEINLIQPSARQPYYAPADRANLRYAFNAGAVAQQQQQQQRVVEVAQPVDEWYPNHRLHHSQAYVQSWNPNAAYNVRLAGPSEYPSEHVAAVQAYTSDHFRRKVSENQPEEPQLEMAVAASSARVPENEEQEKENPRHLAVEQKALTESQVQRVADDLRRAKNKSEWQHVKEHIVQALSSSHKQFIPPKWADKLQKIKQLINDKKAGEESIRDLKMLQEKFEERKDHLGFIYPMVRNAMPPIPSEPMIQD